MVKMIAGGFSINESVDGFDIKAPKIGQETKIGKTEC